MQVDKKICDVLVSDGNWNKWSFLGLSSQSAARLGSVHAGGPVPDLGEGFVGVTGEKTL